MKKHLQKLLNKHTKNWKVDFAPYFERRGELISGGFCAYNRKTIYLTEDIILKNPYDIIKKVFLHEVAHVLAGPKAKHKNRFRKIVRRIGGYPTHRLSKEVKVYTKKEIEEVEEEHLGEMFAGMLGL